MKPAIQQLEEIGKVSVDNMMFAGGYWVCVEIGEFRVAKLRVWGEGESIDAAAASCLSRLKSMFPSGCGLFGLADGEPA